MLQVVTCTMRHKAWFGSGDGRDTAAAAPHPRCPELAAPDQTGSLIRFVGTAGD